MQYSVKSFLLQICDFGLAKWKREAATQTTTGTRRGTVAYMAPEVFSDANMPRTVKYDVYSFGILLWEILCGKIPFENGTDIFILFAALFVVYCVSCLWIGLLCICNLINYLGSTVV